MRQRHQFIVLALLIVFLLGRALGEMALAQQPIGFHALFCLHPFRQPCLPNLPERVDNSLRYLPLSGLIVLQTMNCVESRRRHAVTQIQCITCQMRITQSLQLH